MEELEESEDIGQSVEAPAVITVTPSADLASAVKESGEQKTALKSLSKKKKKKRKRKRVPDAVEGAQSRQGAPKIKKKKRRKATDNSENSTSTEVLPEDEQLSESEVREKMSAWPQECYLNVELLRSLLDQGFAKPTDIQLQSLVAALRDRKDILGAAETGSGKTLAYALPILQFLLQDCTSDSKHLQALILVPTRELAYQVTDHIKLAAKYTSLKAVPVVGGMSVQKQERVLSLAPHIIVATPGRFWELYSQGHEYLRTFPDIRWLVIDEADRMIESGHFEEVQSILQLLPSKSQSNTDALNNQEENVEARKWENARLQSKTHQPRQTFIMSATLGFNVDKSMCFRSAKTIQTKTETVIEKLIRAANLQRKIEIIDLTPKEVVAKKLVEMKLQCLDQEKDYYLFYFLTRHKGKTIVFVNAITNLRRIVPLFTLLRFTVCSLHAEMQQAQRLKSLDRFRSMKHGVLIATDAAARGLDIPNIDHVIHYQLPRTTELYVHRSGRTARANREGLSVMFVGPGDHSVYRKIMFHLTGERSSELPLFPVEYAYMAPVRKRVKLARRVEMATHSMKKHKHHNDWLKQMAQAADIDLDEELLSDDADEQQPLKTKQQGKVVDHLKSELKALLNQPLLPKGVSKKYINNANPAFKGM